MGGDHQPNHDAPGTDAPATGAYCFSASSNAGNELYQDGDLSAEATAIDAGEVALQVSVTLSKNEAWNDLGGFAVTFLDGTDAVLGPGKLDLWVTGPTEDRVWRTRTVTVRIPNFRLDALADGIREVCARSSRRSPPSHHALPQLSLGFP